MKLRSLGLTLARLCLVILAACPLQGRACATCFGRSDSALAQGMNMGILSLLCVIGGVLAGVVVFFIGLARRAAASPVPASPPSSASPADS